MTEQQHGRRPRVAALVLLSLAGAGALAAAPGCSSKSSAGQESALVPDPNMDLLSIPPFWLIDQSGEAFSNEEFLGRVTLLNFFFTSCPFTCPPMTANMKRAQDALAGTAVRLVSVSVDPAHDTPERLREHAAKVGADLSTWTFLTGEREQIARIIRDGLLLAELTDDPSRTIELDGGATMPNIAHPSQIVLIGPEGKPLGLYSGLIPEQIDALAERARRAGAELR